MKVGDLVKYYSVDNNVKGGIAGDNVLIVKLSRTGHTTHSALVMFEDGSLKWHPTSAMEVVNESR